MRSPESIGRATVHAGAYCHIVRFRGKQDSPLVTTLCRIAFDARGRFRGMEHLHYDTFLNAGIGMDNDGKLIRLNLNQYSGIDQWRFVIPEEAVVYLKVEVEREERWLAGIMAVLRKWGYHGL